MTWFMLYRALYMNEGIVYTSNGNSGLATGKQKHFPVTILLRSRGLRKFYFMIWTWYVFDHLYVLSKTKIGNIYTQSVFYKVYTKYIYPKKSDTMLNYLHYKPHKFYIKLPLVSIIMWSWFIKPICRYETLSLIHI